MWPVKGGCTGHLVASCRENGRKFRQIIIFEIWSISCKFKVGYRRELFIVLSRQLKYLVPAGIQRVQMFVALGNRQFPIYIASSQRTLATDSTASTGFKRLCLEILSHPSKVPWLPQNQAKIPKSGSGIADLALHATHHIFGNQNAFCVHLRPCNGIKRQVPPLI